MNPLPIIDRVANIPTAVASLHTGDLIHVSDGMGWRASATLWQWCLAGLVVMLFAILSMSWSLAPGLMTGVVGFWVIFAAMTCWFVARTCRLGRLRRDAARKARLAALDTEHETIEQVARRCWLEAVDSVGSRLPLDVGQILRAAGTSGPRTLVIGDLTLPRLAVPDDLFEEVSMGATRPAGKAERKAQWILLCVAALQIAVNLPQLLGTTPRPMSLRVLTLATWGFFIVFALYRLGLRPIDINATVCAPGRVTHRPRWGMGKTVEFTRDNSVLVLNELQAVGYQRVLTVFLVREDGRQCMLQFRSALDDPAFHQLLHRWTYRSPQMSQMGTIR